MTDTYDDGLVHCHNWAEPLGTAGGAKPQRPETTAPTQASTDDRDEGLVHSHDWARN
jgi:hypothetical protein